MLVECVMQEIDVGQQDVSGTDSLLKLEDRCIAMCERRIMDIDCDARF